MIKEVLDFYLSKQCNHVVITSDVKFILDNIIEDKKKQLSISVIDDVRSAVFFAYGEAKEIRKPVVLFVSGQYLSHCYTGLTEARFQQIPVIVVALYEDDASIYYKYLNPCIAKGFTIKEESFNKYKQDLEKSVSAYGPTLINVVCKFSYIEHYYYDEVLNVLNNVLTKNDTVIFFGNLNENSKYNFKMININDKYGIVSKYMGFLVGNGGGCYLVAPLELFKFDTNIFNNRYINSSFKVIFVNNNDNLLNPQKWIEGNNIEYRVVNDLETKSLTEFILADKPMVLILNATWRNS